MPERLDDYLRRILAIEPPTTSPAGSPTDGEELVQAQIVETPVEPNTDDPRRDLTLASSHDRPGSDLGAVASSETAAQLDATQPLVPGGHRRLPMQEGRQASFDDSATASAPLTGADVAQLLRSPQRLREAILVSEILRSPIEW